MKLISILTKMLASDDPKRRKRGQENVIALLCVMSDSQISLFSYADFVNLCKGLYYSLWMQDKLLLQEDTVARIINCIPHIASRKVRVMYITAMFETLAREWENLDLWRTDKFMMLTRDLFTKTLALAQKRAIPIQALICGVFDKVLNNDYNHAIDLKIFMIRLLQEELVLKQVISTVLHWFYQRTLNTILAIPKGSEYSTHLIKLCLTLSRMLKSHQQLPLEGMSEEALILSTKVPLHRKTLRRLSEILHVKSKRTKGENKLNPINGEQEDNGNSCGEDGTLKKDSNNTQVKENGENFAKPEASLSTGAKKNERKRRRSNSEETNLDESTITALNQTTSTPKANGGTVEQTKPTTPLSTSAKKRQRKRRRRSNSEETSLNESVITASHQITATPKENDEPAIPSSVSKNRSHDASENIDTSVDASSLYVTAIEEPSLSNSTPTTISTPNKESIAKVEETPTSSAKRSKKRRRRASNASDNSLNTSAASNEEEDVALNAVSAAKVEFPLLVEQQTPTQTTPISNDKKKQVKGIVTPSTALFPVGKELCLEASIEPSETTVASIPIHKLSVPAEVTAASAGRKRKSSTGSNSAEKRLNVSLDSILLQEQSSKKRVSFGKVFRKKFSASKLLKFTPTVNNKPDRGILRQL